MPKPRCPPSLLAYSAFALTALNSVLSPSSTNGQTQCAVCGRSLKGNNLMIEVHYWPTPNGKKVTILLEELGVPYKVVPANIIQGDQFEDAFQKISANNRM